MRKRIRLVGGRLTVHSELDRGTEILVEVPFSAAVDAGTQRHTAKKDKGHESPTSAAGG